MAALPGSTLPDTFGDSSLSLHSKASRGTWGPILARIFLVAICLIFLVPLYWMFITSLKSSPELTLSPPTLIPEAWQWSNYAEAVTQIPFFTYFKNTILITVLGTIGSVVSNFVVAYGFACLEWKGRDKVFYLVLATLFIPFPVAIIPSFDLFAWLGWVNTYLPLVVPHFLASAFYIFLLRQFLMQISKEQLDAARIDGASDWRIMWQIVFPLAKPAVMTVAIFTAVGIWNDFLGPLIYLQDTSTQTLSIGLQSFRTATDISWNVFMAASVLTILPLVILFFVFQRYFIRGMTLGNFR